MSKVRKLTDEEISCIITGLNQLSLHDPEYCFIPLIDDLLNGMINSDLYLGLEKIENKKEGFL